MKLEIKKEGKIKFFVPTGRKITKKDEVFYNPEMKFDRDLSEVIVLILKPKKICDCLAGSGVRSLRYKSVLDNAEVVANDKNPKASELIKKNARLNKLEIGVENKDANVLMFGEKFDFIDIDPFGSPIYFLDSCARAIKNHGSVAITATDTAPLCGTSPLTCLRRYGIKSLRTDFSKELGLRILISATIKNFARYDLAFKPIFSYCRRHYFRVFGKIERGAKRADKLLKNFDYISYCQKCGWRKEGIFEKCGFCGNKTSLIQEIYLGDFAQKEFCNKILEKWWSIVKKFELQGKLEELPRKEFEYLPNISRFIRTIRDEQNYPPYYEIHKLCKLNKKQPKEMGLLLEKLDAERTHFSPLGIKTRKSFEEILKALD